ncbi:HD domain-containing protein [Nocardioides convexus]|uniref:HD domain-containing protein n=1 Tax=Nocardioides convexus TaxID=2712224 RepID=UPI002418AC1F|nr:HD domain-containing protein [Nocardioides convexus]
MVRLLAAGRGLLGVWETLEETGALVRILPEWERIRLLPHASAIHRFTVDRHVVETCVEASALIREVSRPDVLVVAALLHDIGKGGLTEHSVAGAPIAREIAERMGFGAEEVDLIGQARALAPAARRPGHHPRSRRPGHHRGAHRARADTRGARAAHRAHRGRRQGGLGQGLVVVARRAGPRPVPPGPVRAAAGERAAGLPGRGDRGPRPRPERRHRDHRRARRRRLPGHPGGAGPGRPAGRRRGDVRPAAGSRAGRADLVPGGVRRLRLGRRRRAPRPRCPARPGSTVSRPAGSTRPPGSRRGRCRRGEPGPDRRRPAGGERPRHGHRGARG